MASQSGTPPMAAENVQNSGPDQSQKEVQQDGKAEVDELNTTPLLVNPEPMREEQVQNAVKFLSHPKVRGSAVIHRRSFLEKKGLTKEEIDEAFRRVPDPPPTEVASNASQDGQVKSPSNFHWSHVILAVGLLISGAGTTLAIKKKIIPRLKSWIHKIVKDGDEFVKREDSRPSLEEEAAAAAKAASEAAINVAKASQEMLNSKSEEMRKMEEIVGLLNMQLYEMKELTSAISSLGVSGDSGRTNSSGRASVAEEGHNQVNLAVPKQLYANGKMNYDFFAVKSSTPQTQVKSSTVPHPNAYMGPPWKVSHAPCNSNPLRELQKQGESCCSTIQNYGTNYLWNSDGSASWRQQHNVRIHEQPIRRPWVPRQPPPVSMLEAAEAIRSSKSTAQTETLANNQLIRPPLLAR